jgi:hypothetical protein
MDDLLPRAGRGLKATFLTILLSSCLSSWVSATKAHDIHVSVCELRWNEESGAFEVSVKIFIDDLERALAKEGAPGLFIGTPRETEEANRYIASYLQKHLTIDVDGTRLVPDFVGKEISDDLLAVWCYVAFPAKMSRSKKCTLSNDILLELYDDQRNIMDIRMNKSHKDYTIFQPGHTTWTYTY